MTFLTIIKCERCKKWVHISDYPHYCQPKKSFWKKLMTLLNGDDWKYCPCCAKPTPRKDNGCCFYCNCKEE